MQDLKRAESTLTNATHYHRNYRTILDDLEIPSSVMQNLSAISPELVKDIKTYYQGNYQSNFCHVRLYTELFSTVEENIETIVHQQKAELLKELIAIKARKNFINCFQDNKEFHLLVKDAMNHSTPSYEERINQELKQLHAFVVSLIHNKIA